MDLQTFILQQESSNSLRRIRAQVDPQLEVAALCRREFSLGKDNRAIFFEQIKGSGFPLVANLFGNEARTAQLLGARSFAQFRQRLSSYLHARTGTAQQRLLVDSVCAPVHLSSPDCQQVIAATDVTALPAIRSWPGEIKPYLTLALLLSSHPETAAINLGLYRAQILGADRIAINFSTGSGAAEHFCAAQRLQQPLPVSLLLGGDPAWLWAAAAPLPSGCNEFSFCQQLFQTRYQFADCISQPLAVPSMTEIVIEGEIRPGDSCHEGPFGNHTGRYVSRADCPVMQVTAVTHRQQPIVPITVVGPPPSENIFLGEANEALLREMLKIDYPQIRDLQMPLETLFHGVSLLSVAPQPPVANRELIDNLWNQSPLAKARLLVLLDEDIDLRSFSQCWWRSINQLSSSRIYQDSGRIAIDATGVDPNTLVVENRQTTELLERRRSEYNL
ncbi:MAG TPA: UbiD family decarboxylase [Malonomonas sp.]